MVEDILMRKRARKEPTVLATVVSATTSAPTPTVSAEALPPLNVTTDEATSPDASSSSSPQSVSSAASDDERRDHGRGGGGGQESSTSHHMHGLPLVSLKSCLEYYQLDEQS